MINNSTNINKIKESLNKDDQQYTNINKTSNKHATKERLKSAGQQFYQYQQNKQ
jgi:hypothetical protein